MLGIPLLSCLKQKIQLRWVNNEFLDLLICDDKQSAIELKVDSTSENEVYNAISQLEDYADTMDAD